MRQFFLIVFSICNSLFVLGHESHFGFAEIKYNGQTQTIQATVSLNTEDFERALSRKNNNFPVHISSAEENKLLQLELSDKVLEDFKVNLGKEVCNFELIGIEVTLEGVTHFYYESQKIVFFDTISILFINLVEDYPEQQNKVLVIFGKYKETLIFHRLQTQPIQL